MSSLETSSGPARAEAAEKPRTPKPSANDMRMRIMVVISVRIPRLLILRLGEPHSIRKSNPAQSAKSVVNFDDYDGTLACRACRGRDSQTQLASRLRSENADRARNDKQLSTILERRVTCM